MIVIWNIGIQIFEDEAALDSAPQDGSQVVSNSYLRTMVPAQVCSTSIIEQTTCIEKNKCAQ